MLKEKIGVCGTITSYRVGILSQLKKDDLKLKKDREPIIMHGGNFVACTRQGTKRGAMPSTIDINLTDNITKSKIYLKAIDLCENL